MGLGETFLERDVSKALVAGTEKLENRDRKMRSSNLCCKKER
jgi:hypothetical protein